MLGRNIDFKNKRKASRDTKLGALTKNVMLVVASEFEDIFHECKNFSVITQNLSRSIGEAQKFLEEFKAPTVTNADEEDEIFYEYDCPMAIGDIVLPEPVRVLEFDVGEDITVESLKYDITFKKFGLWSTQSRPLWICQVLIWRDSASNMSVP